MNGTDVSDAVLTRLSREWEQLTPQAQIAARYVLENPQDVGVSTVREIADAARVKPNTFVRMARQIGFEGYDDFREPFRHAIRSRAPNFPARARWLQTVRRDGAMGDLYADMVDAALTNIEKTFAEIPLADLSAAAETIWTSQSVFTLGVGVNSANAANFTYLASTGMVDFHAIPRLGSTPVDDLARAGKGDALIAMTCRPYRREVVEAVSMGKAQGMSVVAISDSPASPISRIADHAFAVAVDTPQFFPSSVASIALLETMLSFVVAEASDEIVDRVDRFHARRHEAGLYVED